VEVSFYGNENAGLEACVNFVVIAGADCVADVFVNVLIEKANSAIGEQHVAALFMIATK